MKRCKFFYCILVLAFISNVINAQSYPYIQGRGSSASQVAEDRLYPKTGLEYTYKIYYSQGTMPSDKAKLVGWRVEGGDTIKGNGNIPSMNIKWHKGITQGKITAYNVYDAAQKRMTEINTTVYVEDSTLISQSQLNVILSNDLYFVNESFSFQYSLSNNTYNFVSLGTAGDNFVSENWSIVNRTVTGRFTTPGLKLLTINAYYGMKKISSVVKFICIIPREIEGPDVVCSGKEEVFTIPSIPAGLGLNWTLTGDVGLYITSGQGTKAITVRSMNYGDVILNANITYNNTTKTISKNVLANTPRIQYIVRDIIDGSSGGPVYVGSILYLKAYPLYPPSICNYEWTISPKAGTNISGKGPTAMVGVQGTGNYIVQCRVIPSCSSVPSDECANYGFTAQIKTNRPYTISFNQSSKKITVLKSKSNNDVTVMNLNQSRLLQYELYYMETGQLIKKGELPEDGGLIDINNVRNGIYVLTLNQGDDKLDTQKIIVN